MNTDMLPIFYSKDYDELINLENKLMIFGFKTCHNSQNGYYYISVKMDQYSECLLKGRSVADPEIFGLINYYGELVSLYHNSLAYAEFKNDKDLDYDWIINGKKVPQDILEILKVLDKETGLKIDIRIKHSECAYEFVCYGELNNHYEVSLKVTNILKEYSKLFKNVYRCNFTGEVISDEKSEKQFPALFNLFKYSMFIQGINYPIDKKFSNNYFLEDMDKSHYVSEASVVGGDIIKEEYNEGINYLKIKYELEVYEKKKYILYWNALKKSLKKIIPFKRDLIDYIKASTEIKMISENEVVVITDFDVNRKIKFNGIKPINYKDEISVRNNVFSYPIENGDYSDQIVEHYVILKSKKRLLHYSDTSEYFEVYDLPDNFSFLDTNIIDGNALVFNDNSYNLEDKDIDEILNIVYKNRKSIIKKYVNQK